MTTTQRFNANKTWAHEDTDMLRRLAKAGLSHRAIADHLGRTMASISQHAAKHKIRLGTDSAARAADRNEQAPGSAGGPEKS